MLKTTVLEFPEMKKGLCLPCNKDTGGAGFTGVVLGFGG